MQRIRGTLNTRTRAQFYKTCIQPCIDYCLLVWAYCGPEQKKLDHIICKTKQIITNCRHVNIDKSDFKQFCYAKLSDLAVFSVVRQFFTNVYSEDFNANLSLLNQINKSMSTHASFANKSYITLFKTSCDNCCLYTVPKLWNSLANNITSQCNVNAINFYLFKYVFTAVV